MRCKGRPLATLFSDARLANGDCGLQHRFWMDRAHRQRNQSGGRRRRSQPIAVEKLIWFNLKPTLSLLELQFINKYVAYWTFFQI
jgi:hypothetical protein